MAAPTVAETLRKRCKPPLGCVFVFLAVVGCQQSDDQSDSGARETHLLPAWDNKTPGLQIDLPPGFHVVSEKGIDFDVHRIFDSTAAGRATERRIGIYVGHHPGLFEREDRPRKTVKVRGTVANRGARWVCWETEDRGSICEAQVIGVFAGIQESAASDLVLHLWVATSEVEELAQLRRLAASLHLAL
jgi:hypothetical protein